MFQRRAAEAPGKYQASLEVHKHLGPGRSRTSFEQHGVRRLCVELRTLLVPHEKCGSFSTPGRRGAEENTRHQSRSTSIWVRADREQALSTPASRRLGVELRTLLVPHEKRGSFSTPGRRGAEEIPGINRGPQASGSGQIEQVLSNPASRRLGVELRTLLVPHEKRGSVSTPGGRRRREIPGITRGPQHLGPDREQVLSNPASRRLGAELRALLVPHKGRQCFQRRGAETPRKMPFRTAIHSHLLGIDRGPQHLGTRIVNKF